MWTVRHHVALVVLMGAVFVGCTDGETERGSGSSEAPAAPRLAALHATRGTNAAILDDAGREVRLRGVNVNSLGDYHQADPDLPTVVPVTDADWADMAKQGFNVVRLLVSWSSLEPARDVFDDAYIGRVHDAVAAAPRMASTPSSTCIRTRGASSSPPRPVWCALLARSRRSAGTERRSGRR